MHYEINPYIGVGPIIFGMSREETRHIMNRPYKEFKRTMFDDNTTDAYQDIDMYLTFDAQNKCNSIELYEKSKTHFQQQSFIDKSFNQVLAFIKKQGGNYEVDDTSVISYDTGISFFVGDTKDKHATVKSILAFQKGYFDDFHEKMEALQQEFETELKAKDEQLIQFDESILEEFIYYCIEFENANTYDFRTYQKITDITRGFKLRHCLDWLLPCLNHERRGVRLWSALGTFETEHRLSTEVLKELSKGNDYIAQLANAKLSSIKNKF